MNRQRTEELMLAQPHAWPGIDLPERPCDLTYCRIPIDKLPPLRHSFDGALGWLPRPAHELEWTLGASDTDRIFDARTVDRSLRLCADEGFVLPPAMTLFLTSERRNWIRSATGCWLDLSDRLVTIPDTGVRALRFMNDQQGVLYWYLALENGGERGVVVSNDMLDDDEPFVFEIEVETFVCASSFEEFLYRYWIENEIFVKGIEGTALTPDQAAYLRHLGTSGADDGNPAGD